MKLDILVDEINYSNKILTEERALSIEELMDSFENMDDEKKETIKVPKYVVATLWTLVTLMLLVWTWKGQINQIGTAVVIFLYYIGILAQMRD